VSKLSLGRSEGLPPFKLYVPREGHPDFANCFEEARELAAKIRPVIRRSSEISTFERVRDVRRKASALAKAGENFVINRRRVRKDDHALRPLYVIWTMLNDCNFRCRYCDNHQGDAYFDLPDPARLDTELGKRLLEVMRTGTSAIYWCGGEPTLREDLPELLDHAWKLGYFPNMINTNGSLIHQRLTKPEWRNFLWQMDIVIVSLDGLNLQKLNKIWGIKKARQVVVNLLLLRELAREIKFKLVINTVITPESIDEAAAVLDLACDLGVWYVPVPENLRHEPNRALLADPSYVALADRILARKKAGYRLVGSSRLEQLLFARNYRCFTALKPHVWSNGELCWPCRASANVKPVNLNLPAYRSFDEAYAAGRKLVNPDFFHGPAENQCGGECAWAQNYTTARYMEGIRHPVKGGILQEIFDFAFRRRSG